MARARRFGRWRAVRWLGVAALAVSLATALFVETRAQPALDEGALVLASDRWLAEAMNDGNKSIARRLLALQFSYIDEGGMDYTRKNFLGDLKNFATAPANGGKVAMYGLVAAVTGTRMPVSGSTSFFLNIWVKQKRAWRALAMQNVLLTDGAAPPSSISGSEGAKAGECKNPCQIVPYRVRSPAEQDVLNAFLAIEKASIAHDAAEWSRHVADEFALYRSGYAPVSKAERVAAIERQKQAQDPVTVGELQALRLEVYGDAAAMLATEMVPDNSRPPYRAARIWVRRNGQWLMTLSVQTDIQTP